MIGTTALEVIGGAATSAVGAMADIGIKRMETEGRVVRSRVVVSACRGRRVRSRVLVLAVLLAPAVRLLPRREVTVVCLRRQRRIVDHRLLPHQNHRSRGRCTI